MTATLEKQFADCCAAGPLELMIERDEDKAVLVRGALEQPFALIGRDPYCDIHLNDPTVALRHAFAQVIGGHVFVVDLASPTGTHWITGRHASGWLTPGEPLGIGPFLLYLTRSAATNPTVLGPDFHPLTQSLDGHPRVVLEFLSGRTDRKDWEVNRVLTLVGRAADSKLHLAGEDIGLYHAYFVKTVAGLWVVDLLARGGTKVNGKKVRCALLNEGDELAIGRFAIGVKYPMPVAPAASAEDSAVSFNVPDEYASGRINSESLALKSSARIGRPPEDTKTASDGALPTPEADLAPLVPVAPGVDAAVLPLLRQMMDVQSAMFEQFQQSMSMILQILQPQGDAPVLAVQSEMDRMTELNAELKKLHGDLFPSQTPVPLTRLPEQPVTEQSALHHEEMWQRMEKLTDERQGLWQRLIGKGK